MSNKGREQSATKKMMETQAEVTKSFISINEVKEEWERSKQERSTSCISSIKNNVFEKNQLYKTAKKELDNDPDDEDKHEAEKHFHTTVNFLCQEYEKRKKQVGYESE